MSKDDAIMSAVQAIEAREAMSRRPFNAQIVLNPEGTRTAVVSFPRDCTDTEAVMIVSTFLGKVLPDVRAHAESAPAKTSGIIV